MALWAQAPSAEWVMRQAQERDTGRDSRAEMRMRLVDRQGRMRERTLILLSKKGTGGKGDRTLVRFTYPNDIKNTGLLVWEHLKQTTSGSCICRRSAAYDASLGRRSRRASRAAT